MIIYIYILLRHFFPEAVLLTTTIFSLQLVSRRLLLLPPCLFCSSVALYILYIVCALCYLFVAEEIKKRLMDHVLPYSIPANEVRLTFPIPLPPSLP